MINSLLYSHEIKVTDSIFIQIPTVGDVLGDEESYYTLVNTITATPYDMMVQLDDIGIDYTTLNDFDLFLLTFRSLVESDTSLVFGDMDLSRFEVSLNTQNNLLVLRDAGNDIVIDKAVHGQICAALRKVHGMKRTNKKPANKEAQEYLLERARKKLKRNMNRKHDSQLESLIVSLVNTEQFKYRFDEVLDLTIYQFNECVKQIVKKIDYDNLMHGVYAGTISVKDIKQDQLTWFNQK